MRRARIGDMENQMKALQWMTVVVLALVCGALTAQETTEYKPWIAKVTGDSVRLRSGVGTAYPPIKVMEKGDTLTVVGEADGWVKVQLPKDSACWLSKDFVKKGDNGWTVTGKNVNLRITSDTRYFPVGQLDQGASVTPMTDDDGKIVEENGFVKITPPTQATGAISAKFVEKVKNVAPEKNEAASATPATDTAKETTDETKPEAKKPTAAELEDERKTFEALKSSLRNELKKPTEEVDLTEIRKMFQQFQGFALDEKIRKTAADYIERIDLTVKLIEGKQAEVEKEAKARREKFEKAKEAALKEHEPKKEDKGPVEYLVEGTIGATGKTARTPASHRLFDDNGKVLYDLRWDDGDLDRLKGKYVGVVGEVKTYKGWPNKVIVITRVDVLIKDDDK